MKNKKITFEDVAKYYNYTTEELMDMCSENSDLLFDLKRNMKK